MKILLSICGQYRTFEKTFSNIYENLINYNKNCEFDIILNTDESNVDTMVYYKKPKYKKYHYDKETLDEKFKICYGKNLKKIIYYNVSEDDIKAGCVIFQKRCHQIVNYVIENNLLYDMYIFIRFDVIFSCPINLQNYLDKNLSFICSNTKKDGRLDHNRDWDYCLISNNINAINYFFIGSRNNNYINDVSFEEFDKFCDTLNIQGTYKNKIKRWKRVMKEFNEYHLYLKFYNMAKNGYNVYFENNLVFCCVIR
jgi:hypothetical protein